jgi:hypothetical protein
MPTPPLKNYDAAALSIIFKGHLVTGIQQGTFLTAARDQDSWFGHAGGDGEQTRARNNNRAGKVTIITTQSSPSNAVLSAYQLLDERVGGGVGPLLVKDPNGTTLIESAQAYILKPPDSGFAVEATEDREWVFVCPDLQMQVGSAA